VLLPVYASLVLYKCTKHQFTHLFMATFKDLHIENSKISKRWYYSAAHWHAVSVMRAISPFVIFAVFDMQVLKCCHEQVCKLMFCTFIFAVLLLKYCFLLLISYIDIALQIISYSSQAAYNCYLLSNGVNKADDSVRHDVTAGLRCWQYWTKFLLYPRNSHISKQTHIAHITQKTLQ